MVVVVVVVDAAVTFSPMVVGAAASSTFLVSRVSFDNLETIWGGREAQDTHSSHESHPHNCNNTEHRNAKNECLNQFIPNTTNRTHNGTPV
jgi:hypothetical protein